MQLARELESLKQQPEMSRSSARKKLQKQYQVSSSMIKKLEKVGERERDCRPFATPDRWDCAGDREKAAI